jgi:hypothetical protein
MPTQAPICIRRFVEKDGPYRACIYAENGLRKGPDFRAGGKLADRWADIQ